MVIADPCFCYKVLPLGGCLLASSIRFASSLLVSLSLDAFTFYLYFLVSICFLLDPPSRGSFCLFLISLVFLLQLCLVQSLLVCSLSSVITLSFIVCNGRFSDPFFPSHFLSSNQSFTVIPILYRFSVSYFFFSVVPPLEPEACLDYENRNKRH